MIMLNVLNREIMLTIFAAHNSIMANRVSDVFSKMTKDRQQKVLRQSKEELRRSIEEQLANLKSIKW